MTTSEQTTTTDVASPIVTATTTANSETEPVIQQVLFPTTAATTSTTTASQATTSPSSSTLGFTRVEDPYVAKPRFSFPALTTGLGTLSSTATTAIQSTTSEGRPSTFEGWKQKLKNKEGSGGTSEGGIDDLGLFEVGGGSAEGKVSGPHGVSPSTMVYKKPAGNVQSDSMGVVNLGTRQRLVFEAARKRAQADIAADMDSLAPPFASGDPFSRPKVQDVQRFSYEPCSPDTATAENIEHIQADLIRAGVPKQSLTFALWDIARYCADAGSSESTEFVGTSSYGGRVARMEIAAIIKKHTTLRRFCGFYAKIVWNIMLVTNIPPSGWMKKGYKENTKFAAFDFFVHVSNNAALEPENGLVRKPYHEELVAAQANKGVVLHRTEAAQDKNASTAHEVTGGRAGPRSRLLLKGKEMD